jgi:hypothetical protein
LVVKPVLCVVGLGGMSAGRNQVGPRIGVRRWREKGPGHVEIVIQRFPNNASGDGSELDACLLVVVVVARLLVVLVIGSLGLDLLLMPREKEEQGGRH